MIVCSECGSPWRTCKCQILRDSENSAVPVSAMSIADRVAMSLAEAIREDMKIRRTREYPRLVDQFAAALSSHGLFQELVKAAMVVNSSYMKVDGKIICPQVEALTALLGEGETPEYPPYKHIIGPGDPPYKAEEQADG